MNVATTSARAQLGIDIGGTFTDFVLVKPDGSAALHKCPTTPADPAVGLLHGVDELLAREEVPASALRTIVHSTTLATNAIIERKGARVGLLITHGFADQLELRTEQRYDIHDMRLTYPPPLVERARRREVHERMFADGRAARPPDRNEVVRIADELVANGANALAVVLLHAYRFADHEDRIVGWLRERYPSLPISASSRVAPVIGEYVRLSTTVADAYVKPAVDEYLGRLEGGLVERGFGGTLSIVLSTGLASSARIARAYPVRLVESGPAAGAVASAAYSRSGGLGDLLAFDMGGTTAKACLIVDGELLTGRELEVARVHRFKHGSGLPLAVPSVDLLEIGAGGGSIGRVDSLGLLKVGPDSAGAMPGPACYGHGGTKPTVTDADLLLGYLSPDDFLGGRMKLSRERAEEAVSLLGAQLGMSTIETAWGIRQVVDEMMAQAARAHLIEHNRDPRSLRLIAFGGAGPSHAFTVARRLRTPEVICPLGAGVTSALGGLAAPFAFTADRAFPSRLDRMDWDALNRVLDEMDQEGRHALADTVHDPAAASSVRYAECRLLGQLHVVPIPIPNGLLGPADVEMIRGRFRDAYSRRYGRFNDAYAVEAMAWHVRVSVPPPPLVSLRGELEHGTAAQACTGERAAWFGRHGWLTTPIYNRYALGPTAEIVGPAIVQERESTIVLGPGDMGRVLDNWSLVISINSGDRP